MTPASQSAGFPNTSWSCIRAAKDANDPLFVAALNRLMATYWRPIFHYLRALGHPAADAEDLTQAFFLRFLVKGWLQRVDAERGRFRHYLRTLVKRFAYDRTARAPAQAKFEDQFVSIASLIRDSDRAYEPPAHEPPEEAFERQWKAEIVAAAQRNLRAYYEGTDKAEDRLRFQVFAARHFVGPGEDQPTQEALAAQVGRSRDYVRDALHVVEERYRRFLRQEIRDQVSSEEEVDEEIANLP